MILHKVEVIDEEGQNALTFHKGNYQNRTIFTERFLNSEEMGFLMEVVLDTLNENFENVENEMRVEY